MHTWLVSTEYTPTASLVLTGMLQYTCARNFNDTSLSGIPYGADFDQVNLTAGAQWTLGEQTTLGVDYGFYHYKPNSSAEFDGYDAHLISLEVTKKF